MCSYIRFDTDEEAVNGFKALAAFLESNEDF
jgi:hypothetical protein